MLQILMKVKNNIENTFSYIFYIRKAPLTAGLFVFKKSTILRMVDLKQDIVVPTALFSEYFP